MKEITLPIYLIEEGPYISAFCPALNLAGQGHNEETAIKSFYQTVQIFLDETSRKGTLSKILRQLKVPAPKPRTTGSTDIPSYLFEKREVSVPLPCR